MIEPSDDDRDRTQPLHGGEGLAAGTPPAQPEHAEAGLPETAPYRPTDRPPMAVLQILDDGLTTGEFVRIRKERFLIGRAEGDVIIPHDPQISGRHAEVYRQLKDDRHRWHLRDLGSTNGTFLRVTEAVLEDNAEVIIARRRLRFVGAPGRLAPDQQPAKADIRQTRVFGSGPQDLLAGRRPSLVELFPDGEGRRFSLRQDDLWIGRDPDQCSVTLPDDPTVSPRHARLEHDGRGRWHIEDADSLNGVWIRITDVPLTLRAAFLLGDQVFVITFP